MSSGSKLNYKLVFTKQLNAAPGIAAPQRSGHPVSGGTIDTVPELPEVESLAVFLRERATGAEIDWAASTAISVL